MINYRNRLTVNLSFSIKKEIIWEHLKIAWLPQSLRVCVL